MLRMQNISLALVALIVSAPCCAGTQKYLCAIDQMTGFSYNKDTSQWESANFRSSRKFLVEPSQLPGYVYEVKELGHHLPAALCKNDFNSSSNLFCDGFARFNLNGKTLRFIFASTTGYWNDDPNNEFLKPGANTPALGIGKCSKI